MIFENNITKAKASRINAIKDRAFREELDLERTLALNEALKDKLGLFQNLKDRAEAHSEAIGEIASEIQALIRYLGGLTSETDSLTQWSRKAISELDETHQRLQTLGEQGCVICQMLKALQEIVDSRRAKNPLISVDLVAAIDRTVKAANKALANALSALSICIQAERTSEDALSLWKGSLAQLDDLNKRVVGDDERSRSKSFSERIENARSRTQRIGELANRAYEKVNEQHLAVETQAAIDQALYNSTLVALKAAEKTVSSSRFS